MGTVVDLKSYAIKQRRMGKRPAPRTWRRNQTTADIHIWDGIRIERQAVIASVATDKHGSASEHARP